MSERTLIKASAGEHCISFRTVSRKKKSPWEFLVCRSELEKLERDGAVIAQDIHGFAVLSRNIPAGTLHMEFTWLCGGGNEVTGYKEDMVIRYDELMAFIHASAQEGGPTKWAALSIMENRLPRLVFYDTAGLRRCLENVKVRRKLIRFLRDNFHWPDVDEVGFYPDFDPYSFFFREIRYGAPGIAGGLILHNRGSMEKAYYATHT